MRDSHVQQPTAPQPYTAPTPTGTDPATEAIVSVADYAELAALLGQPRGVCTDVVLTGPLYDGPALQIPSDPNPTASWIGVRFTASSLLGATVRCGFEASGNQPPPATGGWQGVLFDCDDPAKAAQFLGTTALLYTWGQAARGLTLRDCVFRSSAALAALDDLVNLGIYTAGAAHSSSGWLIERCRFEDLRHNAVLKATTGATVETNLHYRDVHVRRIYELGRARGSLNSLNGAECGIASAQVGWTFERLRIEDCGSNGMVLAGVETKQSFRGTHLWMDYMGATARTLRYWNSAGVGAYAEDTRGCRIEHGYFGPHMGVGTNAEWSGVSGETANSEIELIDCVTECYKFGALFQDATADVTMSGCQFFRSWKAPWLAEPNCTNIVTTPDTSNSYLLEVAPVGVVSAEPLEDVPHGGAFESPPSGWRMHPDQYDGVLAADEIPGCLFFGASESGDWANLAVDQCGGSSDMAVGSGHMWLQAAKWGVAGGKTFAVKLSLSPGATPGAWIFRQASASNVTVQGVRIGPTAGVLRMAVDGGPVEDWTPMSHPVDLADCILLWQTEPNGVTSTIHLLNLATGDIDFHRWRHPAIATNSNDTVVVGNEQVGPALEQRAEPTLAFGAWDNHVEAGDIARLFDPVIP